MRHRHIVHDHREVVGGQPVLPEQHEVANHRDVGRDRPADEVGERDGGLGADAEADGRRLAGLDAGTGRGRVQVRGRCRRTAACAPRAPRLHVRRRGRLANRSSSTRDRRRAADRRGRDTAAAARSADRGRTRHRRSGPSSQSMPSQRRSSRMPSADATVERASSVSSRRSTNVPPWPRASSQLNSAVRALPTWRCPVGLGAKRTRIGSLSGNRESGIGNRDRESGTGNRDRQVGPRLRAWPAVTAPATPPRGRSSRLRGPTCLRGSCP